MVKWPRKPISKSVQYPIGPSHRFSHTLFPHAHMKFKTHTQTMELGHAQSNLWDCLIYLMLYIWINLFLRRGC